MVKDNLIIYYLRSKKILYFLIIIVNLIKMDAFMEYEL
jgi:hypothetical protein